VPAIGVPRLPLVPDPLRRIEVPSGLEPLTTTAAEEEPAAGGMTAASIERIWAAAEGLYRSGVHPAVQLCVRREGAVVLDRAIGHARGSGPGEPEDAERVAAPETPFTIYSASKAAATRVVAHTSTRRGRSTSATAWPSTSRSSGATART
jgi:CubicO group peptidase (beta-lactamase class C family)